MKFLVLTLRNLLTVLCLSIPVVMVYVRYLMSNSIDFSSIGLLIALAYFCILGWGMAWIFFVTLTRYSDVYYPKNKRAP